MDLSSRFRINKPQVISDTIDDEVVIIEFESGNYYSLDKAGVGIWHMIESGTSVGKITEGITHLYSGTTADIERAIGRIITKLQRENLIVLCEAKEPESTHENFMQAITCPETERPNFEAPVLEKHTDMQQQLLLDPIHVDDTGWPTITPDSSKG